jgi:hypothetical protein
MTHRDDPDPQVEFDQETHDQETHNQDTPEGAESFTQGPGGRSGDSSCFISIIQQ